MRLRRPVAHDGAVDGEGRRRIILYLDQEGRGNGLASKIKAYRLQADGFDTFDADEVLASTTTSAGFDFAAPC